MRFIETLVTCKPLQRRRHNKPDSDIAAKKAWRRFNKQAIRKSCYKQQFGLCAYTEVSLDNTVLGNHLEHIAPRSRFPERTFEPHNIILAAMNETYAGRLEKQEQFGGHFKKAIFDDTWFISPFNANCEQYFHYCHITGVVSANNYLSETEQSKAVKTIETLNLNCQHLVDARLKQLTELQEHITTLLDSYESAHDQQLAFRHFKTECLAVKERKLPEFISAKRQLFDAIEQQRFGALER